MAEIPPRQITAVRDLLTAAPDPLTPAQIAQHFTRANKPGLAEVLQTLILVGYAIETEAGEFITTQTYSPW